MNWKKGRGKLGPLAPLLGSWVATAESPMGKVKCSRTFTAVLGGNYIELACTWHYGKGAYEERALFGAKDGVLTCWSFTSDGKSSIGTLSAAPEVHKDAVCFEAEMPAGLARQIYWPNEGGGFNWAVESKNKKGWKRFVEHHYKVR
jgi:hypothetical protein